MAAAIKATKAPLQPEPTREQLRMAYRHYADHHWPDTLDAALLRPAYRAVITQLARRLNRPDWRSMQEPAHHLPQGPVPPTPCDADRPKQRPTGSIARPLPAQPPRPVTAWRSNSRPGTHDCKRAAANDKDGTA